MGVEEGKFCWVHAPCFMASGAPGSTAYVDFTLRQSPDTTPGLWIHLDLNLALPLDLQIA